MKQFKYILALALSVLVITVPIAVIAVGIYFYMQTEQLWVLGVAAGIAILCFMLNGVVRELRVDAREASQTNEYGEKKLSQYKYLSQKEKEQVDLIKTATRENIMSSSALKKMIQEGPKDPMKELQGLIGLQEVKDSVEEMVARMKFESEERKKKKGAKAPLGVHHMCFTGSPGTGKTTVARIMTSFLYQFGYIKENKCIEIDGNFLKAGTDSAAKTELVMREAFGGVLFIDEAYSLMDSSDNSGEQVIATLIKLMEDKRDQFVLILAGYTNEMRHLIAMNPGFESRIKDYLHFPDYDNSEMREILEFMAKKQNFSVGSDVYATFDAIVERERGLQSFGNARTVRNILEKAIDKHALNIMRNIISPEDRYVLRDADFRNLKLGGIAAGMEGLR